MKYKDLKNIKENGSFPLKEMSISSICDISRKINKQYCKSQADEVRSFKVEDTLKRLGVGKYAMLKKLKVIYTQGREYSTQDTW